MTSREVSPSTSCSSFRFCWQREENLTNVSCKMKCWATLKTNKRLERGILSLFFSCYPLAENELLETLNWSTLIQGRKEEHLAQFPALSVYFYFLVPGWKMNYWSTLMRFERWTLNQFPAICRFLSCCPIGGKWIAGQQWIARKKAIEENLAQFSAIRLTFL